MAKPDYAYYRGYNKYYCYSDEDESDELLEDVDIEYAIDEEQLIQYCRDEFEEDYPTLKIVKETKNEFGYTDSTEILFQGKEAEE